MPDIGRARAFLDQAKADYDAAQLTALTSAHRRYFLQQACEKAVKALGYAKYKPRPGDGRELNPLFFNRHDPLLRLTKADVKQLPNGARALRREVLGFLARFPEREALLKLDATTPSTDPLVPSYRYPFQLDAERWVAPATFREWDTYQGNWNQVQSATQKLLRRVADEVALSRRRG